MSKSKHEQLASIFTRYSKSSPQQTPTGLTTQAPYRPERERRERTGRDSNSEWQETAPNKEPLPEYTRIII